MKPHARLSIIMAGIAGVIIGLAIAISFDLSKSSAALDKAEQEQLRKNLEKNAPVAQAINQIYRDVYKLVSPSVVSITTERKSTISRRPEFRWKPEIPREWRRYFDFEWQWPELPDIPRKERGEGSGVIVDEQGHILTNAHVVDGMEKGKIKVYLYNDKSYDAKIVAMDKKSDLAVLKIEATDLVPARLGDSDALQVGDTVAAIGSPFGLSETFSVGIVSALGRTRVGVISSDFRVENFIQTDAAINPGNSGGPLVNMRGEVIGINTAIATRSGAFNGIGFAIPTSIAKPVMESLIKHGKVVRGYLGVQIADINDAVAEREGYKDAKDMSTKLGLGGKTEGAYVVKVMADTPAFKANLQPGDVIVEYQGKPVKNVDDLRNRVSATAVGTKAMLKIIRGGKPLDVTVTIAEQPEEAKTAMAAKEEGERVGPNFGIIPEKLTPQAEKKYGYAGEEGVLVGSVEPGSPADLAGLKEGDLIREVDGKPVKSIKEFNEAMSAARAKGKVRLLVRNEDGLAIVTLKVRDTQEDEE